MSKVHESGNIYEYKSTSRYGREVDESRCRAAVYGDWSSSQCGNKAKYFREVEYKGEITTLGYCGIHDPPRVAKKKAERAAAWEEKMEAWQRKGDLQKAKAEALELVMRIAAGHNDPRGACLEFLNNRPFLTKDQ